MHSRKPIKPLSRTEFEAKIADGLDRKMSVGNGLIYHKRGGSALWLFQFRNPTTGKHKGKHNATQLGRYPGMSLNAARLARNDFDNKRRNGGTEERQLTTQHRSTVAPAKRARFADVVDEYLAKAPAIKKLKVTSDEPTKLYPKLKDGKLGKMWTHEIDVPDVAAELIARWGDGTSAADHFKIRFQQVFKYAHALKYRAEGQINPANNDDIRNLVQGPPATVHHPALPLEELPAFMRKLAADGSNAARALAFCIHTGARKNEAREADWSEINAASDVWTIPGGKGVRSMKQGKEHSVPLSQAAQDLLGERGNGRIFGKIADRGMLDKVKKLGGDFTNHGMRAVFNEWADRAGYQERLWGRALSHPVGNATVQAYNRAKLIEDRRPMMAAWSQFLADGVLTTR